MKGKSVLTSQQIAHVLALHLAGRSLFIEELALLTGNVLPASDERWRELERLGLAERVSSPHGTAWKAGDETAAFIRSQLPLLKEFFRPDEKAYALTCLHEQASLSDCETVLSRISQCAERDRNILPLLELAVLFLLRWGRRNGSTAGRQVPESCLCGTGAQLQFHGTAQKNTAPFSSRLRPCPKKR